MASAAGDISPPERNIYTEEDVDDNDDILYGDLDETGRSAELQRLVERVDELTKKNDNLTSELTDTKQQLQTILAEKEQLEKNIVVLYNTALREIERKDKQLSELRKELSGTREK